MNRKFPWNQLSFRIHPALWIVISLAVWTGYFYEILTLLTVVVIHELGHVTAAWSFGWRIRSIELLPFGGVAQMEEWGTAPAREEITVSLAGPFYHVYMVLFSLGFWKLGWWDSTWTEYFVMANISIALFNLLPIYPLDGGRIVQALLSKMMPYQRALIVSLYSSVALSILLIFFSFSILNGLGSLPFLVIGAFLIFANYQAIREQKYPLWRMLFHRYHQKGLADKLPCQEISLSRTDSWTKILPQWRKEKYHLIKVFHDKNGKLLAVYPEEAFLRKLFHSHRNHLG